MVESAEIKLEIRDEADIRRALEASSLFLESTGFSKLEWAGVQNAVSEIVTNVTKYAERGSMQLGYTSNGRGVEITVEDHGPGISNVEQALQGKLKGAKSGFGIGLAAAKRAMDEFFIDTKAGEGTTVRMLKYLPLSIEEIEYGVVSLSKAGEVHNGDQYVIREYHGDSVLLAVIDGEGHGAEGYEAGVLVKNLVEQSYARPLDEVILEAHELLLTHKGRGAVLGLCRLMPGSFEYLGLGDTNVFVISKERVHPFSQPGSAGHVQIKLPKLKIQKFPCPWELTIVLVSDGIRKFDLETLPLGQPPQKIADFIVNNFRRESDDATVLVASRKLLPSAFPGHKIGR
jgi:serine/threonine-protein kinase RsbT